MQTESPVLPPPGRIARWSLAILRTVRKHCQRKPAAFYASSSSMPSHGARRMPTGPRTFGCCTLKAASRTVHALRQHGDIVGGLRVQVRSSSTSPHMPISSAARTARIITRRSFRPQRAPPTSGSRHGSISPSSFSRRARNPDQESRPETAAPRWARVRWLRGAARRVAARARALLHDSDLLHQCAVAPIVRLQPLFELLRRHVHGLERCGDELGGDIRIGKRRLQ